MTAAKHKRRAGSSSVSHGRYRFSNPTLLYPKTLFSCVTVAEGVREEIKVFLPCMCLFSSCSTEYKSFCLITVRRGSRLPSTAGPPLVFPCTPEEALGSTYSGWRWRLGTFFFFRSYKSSAFLQSQLSKETLIQTRVWRRMSKSEYYS